MSPGPVIGESQDTLMALGVAGCMPSVEIRLDGLADVHFVRVSQREGCGD